MRHILQPFRFFGMLLVLVIYILHMALVWLFVREHWARVRWSNRILKRYSRLGLWLLKVKPNYIGVDQLPASGRLFVGNHLSYMDVLVVHGLVPACFVTSKEIKETPVLGQVCQLAGCLFVERRSRMNLRGEVSEIAAGLQRGFSVAIFPEATSTNGEKILRFKRPLFTAAEQSGAPVVPFCLNYHTVGGRPINVRTRDKIFWYGDMGFAAHLWALAGSGGVLVDLHFLPALRPQDGLDASGLSERAQAAVEAVFRPATAPAEST